MAFQADLFRLFLPFTDTSVFHIYILLDLFYYGEEGVNFEYTADGRVHKINNDWALAGYTQGSFFTVTTLDTDEFNQWDEVKALNEAARPLHPAILPSSALP